MPTNSDATKYTLTGRITNRQNRALAGLTVRAFDQDPESDDLLGHAVTDAEGKYTIQFTEKQIKPFGEKESGGPDVYILLYDDDVLLHKSPVKRNAGQKITINLKIAYTIGDTATKRRIEGRIMLEQGIPAEKIKLRLYRRDFGGKAQLLVETTTRTQGLYTLAYNLGGTVASLEIRAVDAAGKEIPLSKPMNYLGQDKRQVINLAAPAELQPLEAEYRRLAKDLKPHVGDMKKLADVQENGKRQDITALNRSTGWDARLIALAAMTERLSADTDVKLPQEAVYGLLRVGLPSDKLMLAQVEPDVAEKALKKVRDAGIIEISDQQIGRFKRQFTTFTNKVRLAMPAPGSRSTYDEILKASDLSDKAQAKFAPVYLSHQGDAAQLWDKARKAGLDDVQINTLQKQGKFAFLAGNSEAMTTRLMQKQVNDPVQLVDQDFHQADVWAAEVFEQAGIPANRRKNLTNADKKKLEDIIPVAYPGKKVEDRLKAYTEDMARKVRLSYPTHVIGRMIEQDNADAFKLGAARGVTAKLLKRAAGQGFRLGETPVTAFLQSHTGIKESLRNPGMTDAEFDVATQELRTLQRVYQITPGNEAMPVLLSLGMTSAYDVMAYSESVFAELYAAEYFVLHGSAPTEAETELVYRKAQQVSSVTYNLFTIAKKLDSEATVQVISAPVEVRESVRNELIKQFPTMESLFGSMDFCECEHCHSVLSPAAYFVDLLQFIDVESEVWSNFLRQWETKHGGEQYTAKYKKPYDALIERRPDLPHIPLTCENTHTALPYIDIVNEILEYYVANGKLEEDAAHDTGEATTAELLAEPQNVIREAYDKLHQARYPLNLPFDLWIETVRQFCNYFETPLADILEAFRRSDDLFAPTQTFDRSSIFFESLGLSPAEVTIFTDPDPLANDKWHELYGYPTVRPVIQNPTNVEQATLAIGNDDAKKFEAGTVCAYFDTSANDVSAERKTISTIGAADSDGAGQTKITFSGIWNTPPDAGDLLVCDASSTLKSAKTLSRRIGVTYKEIVEIVKTGFVNPELEQLAILYKLGVSVQDARVYLDNKGLIGQDPTTLTEENQRLQLEAVAFENKLEIFANEFKQTLAQIDAIIQAIPFDTILLLADPDAGCNFDLTTLQYADGTMADPIVYLRINLFVRLWRKLGWSIEETDGVLSTFIPQSAPFDGVPANLAKKPLKTALIYLAHLKALDEKVRVGKQSRLKLITLWSDIATTGKKPLYAQLFLTRSVLKNDAVFDDPLGHYLSAPNVAAMAQSLTFRVQFGKVAPADKIDPALFAAEPKIEFSYDVLQKVQHLTYEGVLSDAEKADLNAISPSPTLSTLLDAVQVKAQEFSLVKGHMLALQGALGITAEEIGRILEDAGKSLDSTELSLPHVSLLYRYRLLAKALKLSLRELIALKQLSGLDPFKLLHSDPITTIDEDYPFSQTLRFVEIVNEIKKSGLKIEDLDYLLRHRFDETGKYRPDSEGTLVLLKTLAEGVRSIRDEHAIPDDPAEMGNEMLLQKLGLILTSDVVERFISMMNGTVEFTATKTGVADALDPETFAEEPAIREVSHNATLQEQKLTFRGVLFDAQKGDLITKFDGMLTTSEKLVFAELLDKVQSKAHEFFDKHLKIQAPNVQPAAGFLESVDFGLLFTPLPEIDESLTDEQKKAARESNNDKLREKRTRLATAFLPFLQHRLIRQFIVQTMTAHTDADPVLVESLLTDERLLATADPAPLLTSFAAIGERGVSAAFFDSNDQSGTAQATKSVVRSADTGLKDTHDAGGNPLNTANSAQFEGYLEVPTPGAYRFYIEMDKQNAEAKLHFDHLADPLFLQGTAAADNTTLGDQPDEFLELKSGIPYRFSLELKKLNGGGARLLVQGETLPKDGVSQLTLYPLTAMEKAEGATVLLAKTLQLLQSLGLSEREIRYLLTAGAAAFGGLNLSNLPTKASDDTPAGAQALFGQFLRLTAYTRLKRDLAGGTDDLIGVFEANGTGDLDTVYPLIAKLTRHDASTVKASANALLAAPAFASEKLLQRLWEVLQVVERFGVPVASLLEWTRIVNPAATPEQRFEIARDLKESIKARFEPETWQRVALPIFDKLRQRQRDALVVYVKHQHGFVRIEQLYEYFLIDPGMEPVVQTSRIRLAIGSVQLFIQRCLLNLELQVHPSVINTRQWEWMKRYRVWEANRKIFLFPENWLEPEFRDDKTHLFAELEGALLQGDVSSDLVEDAFLNYLKKLDELARLDIVAMHLEDKANPVQNTLHVIGRTFSQPHKYFYRRYSHQMWTPWEPVSAEIEGDHLAPVIWRDRLYLFWVTFMDKPVENPEPGSTTSGDDLADANVADLYSDISAVGKEKQIDVQLHWSEYLEGEWSTRQSSEFFQVMTQFSRGVTVQPAMSSSAIMASTAGASGSSAITASTAAAGGSFVSHTTTIPLTVALDFDPTTVFIHVSKEPYENGQERGVFVHLKGPESFHHSFYLAGRNSGAERTSYKAKPANPYGASAKRATRYLGGGAFTVEFKQRITTEPGKSSNVEEPQTILQQSRPYTLLPCDNNIDVENLGIAEDAYQNASDPVAVKAAIERGFEEITSLMKPIFYQDNAHTLFIEPNVTERTIEEWQDWVTRTPQPGAGWSGPGFWDDLKVIPEIPWKEPIPIDPEELWRDAIDPGSLINPAPGMDWLVNPGTVLELDGVLIGPAGRPEVEIMPADIADGITAGGQQVNVNPGSGLTSGSAIVLTGATTLEENGLTSAAGGLNVIGGSGVNATLVQNINELNRSGFGAGMSGAGRAGR